MAYRPGSTARNAAARRGTGRPWALPLLFVAAISLLVVGSIGTAMIERVRSGVTDVVAPVLGVLAGPVGLVSGGIRSLGDFLDVYGDNARLREQNVRLLEWQHTALTLAAENARLRKLVDYRPDPAAAAVSARVVGDSTGVFVRSVLTDAGSDAGLARGNAVVDATGLIGRVIATGRRHARVLLITDLNSRVPVTVQRHGVSAILTGDNSASPRLRFLSAGTRVRPGDRVVTSGDGNVFPPDLPVGEIVEVDGDRVLVKPLADLGRLAYVRVLTATRSDLAERAGRFRKARHLE